MYAVIKTGGHQYRVSKNDVITVNRIEGKEGDSIDFDDVLLVRDKDIVPGTPCVKNAKVCGVIVSHKRGKKILVGKHIRRKDHQKITGFRADLTDVRIENIQV